MFICIFTLFYLFLYFRETTKFTQKETFNKEVVNEVNGTEEYVHLKSLEDEIEFMEVFIYLFIYLFNYLIIYLFIHLFVYLFIYLFI